MNDPAPPSLPLAAQLLQVADALDTQYMLRRALVEPNADPQQRAQVVDALLGKAIAPGAVAVVREAAARVWPSAEAFAGAVRDAAISVAWQVAVADGSVETVRGQVLALIQAIAANPTLSTALGDPSREPGDRAGLVDTLVAGTNEITQLLAGSAVGDPRGPLLANLSACLDGLARLRGHQRAKVASAVALDSKQTATLVAELTRIYGVPIDLEARVDAGVVGGVRVDTGGDVIDGSIKARLDAARTRMAGEEGNHV